MTHIDPTKDAFSALEGSGAEGPVQMLNLLRFRTEAAYDDPALAPVEIATGEAAYREYIRASRPVFEAAGGRIVWSARPVAPVIGPPGERWDLGFIAEYPSLEAFTGMVRDEAYRAVVHHRRAGVADSRLHAFAKGQAGAIFHD